MSTAPIINVNNVVSSNAATAKVSSPTNSSDQSFGQVLSREVGGRNTANGDTNSGQSTSSTPTPTTAANTSNPSGGKNVKSKSNTDASQTGSVSSNTSADAQNSTQGQMIQIIAQVSNTQSATSGPSNLPLATNDANPVGAINSANQLAIDQAVSTDKLAVPLATNPAALPSGASSISELAMATNAPNNPAIGTAAQALLDTPQKPVIAPGTSAEQTANKITAEIGNIQQVPDTLASQIDSIDKAALDLSALTEKNIQSGLATLNSNATKVDQATQGLPAITATATALPTLAVAQALPNNPNDKLTPQVGSTGWDQAVGQKVVWMVAGGQQNASLTLNPPDLGPLQVVLNVTNSHATVTFTSTQPEVRQALESAIPKLREMLGDAGIQLGQASINSGSAQQQAFSQQNSANTNSTSGSVDNGDSTMPAIRALPTSAGQGLVDTFA
jgi:flagellar hook-length control protein FliK